MLIDRNFVLRCYQGINVIDVKRRFKHNFDITCENEALKTTITESLERHVKINCERQLKEHKETTVRAYSQ